MRLSIPGYAMTSASTVQQIVSLKEASGGRSLARDAVRRLMRNPLALLGLGIVVAMILIAVFASWIAPYSPLDSDLSLYVTPPSPEHVLGTDDVGRDVLSRVIYGARISLSVSMLSIAISLIVGVSAGLLAGYYGGLIDTLIMRITDVVLGFPP